jgi:hypothetical protein
MQQGLSVDQTWQSQEPRQQSADSDYCCCHSSLCPACATFSGTSKFEVHSIAYKPTVAKKLAWLRVEQLAMGLDRRGT